jgi:hypothetical protein
VPTWTVCFVPHILNIRCTKVVRDYKGSGGSVDMRHSSLLVHYLANTGCFSAVPYHGTAIIKFSCYCTIDMTELTEMIGSSETLIAKKVVAFDPTSRLRYPAALVYSLRVYIRPEVNVSFEVAIINVRRWNCYPLTFLFPNYTMLILHSVIWPD